MKKLVSFLFIVLFAHSLWAQYSTPGTGVNYTLEDLVNLSGGVVSNHYKINADLTITYPDGLIITTDTEIEVAEDVLIDIQGKIHCGADIYDYINCGNSYPTITFTTANENIFFRGFKINNQEYNNHTSGSYFKNTHIERSGGIKLQYTDSIMFDHCTFINNNNSNASGVIDCFHSSPFVLACHFENNSYSAISSGANAGSSPKILFSYFKNNVTSNTNRPQINLGNADEMITIYGNYIEGNPDLDKVGGIAVSTLVGGNIEAVIRNNTIINNRYGITCIGNNIESDISHNTILDNNTETNPMQGGSGINCYGNITNTSDINHNRISGNLWGITAVNAAQLSMNTGYNYIVGNGNNETLYELYNNTSNNIMAPYNYWGGDASVAEAGIVHQIDNPSLGWVEYNPVLTQVPNFEYALDTLIVTDMEGDDMDIEIDETHKCITIVLPPDYGSEILDAVIEYVIPENATMYLNGEEIHSGYVFDFTPANAEWFGTYLLEILPECGAGTYYTITLEPTERVQELYKNTVMAYPNPTSGCLQWQGIADVEIWDMYGKQILQKQSCESLDINHLSSGNYILKLIHVTGTYVQKIVKE